MSSRFLLFAVLISGATPARAYLANNVVNLLLPQAFPVDPLVPEQWAVKVAPAIVSFSNDSGADNVDAYEKNDLSGYGAAVGVTYSFTRKFGLTFEGNYYSLTGEFTGDRTPRSDSFNCPGCSDAPGDNELSGWLGALAMVYDPLGERKKERLHLPLLLGVGYSSMKHKLGNSPGYIRNGNEIELSGMGVLAGVSAQITTGPVRWLPFFNVFIPSGQEASCSLGCDPESSTGAGGNPGLFLTYVPWNLSTMLVVPAFGGGKTSVYTLSWQKKFGGSAI